MLILMPLVSLSRVLSINITHDENCYLKEHCGAHVLVMTSIELKIDKSKKREDDQHDYGKCSYKARKVNRWNRGKKERVSMDCSILRKQIDVSIIWQRNFYQWMQWCTNLKATCYDSSTLCNSINEALFRKSLEKQVRRDRYSVEPQSSIQILIGSGCLDPEHCKHLTTYSVTSIKVHAEYDPCQKVNDLALFDIWPEISPEHGSPICMTKPRESLHDQLTAVGFGIDREFNFLATTRHMETGPLSVLRSVNLTRMKNRPQRLKRIPMYGIRRGICNGDSGGPLAQDNEGKYTVEGIAMSMMVPCNVERDTRISIFVDLREYIDWICMNTGVCLLTNIKKDCEKPPSQMD
ncbi:trypsin [Dictyocaulus viviparus]|uniref:Trypsin n=1 Tax=Dictyocaulus viviparus TaxID=29172 RepID=A0A0D8XH19_DICVI|nr:trypsin [Dictyocaulus viviparus]